MHADLADMAGDSCGSAAEHACVICYENEGDHVFLHCGHGGYCSTCAYKLLAAPRGLCPVCRAALSAVCKIPQDTPIGDVRVVSPYACTPAVENQPTVASEPATAPHSDSRGDGTAGENVPEATNSNVLEHSEVHDDDVEPQRAASLRSSSPSQRSMQMTDVATGGGNDAAAPVATSAVLSLIHI